jgi:DNA-binding MarR family transcriptional regulator
MSTDARAERLAALVAAFSEMGPAWARWVQSCVPDDTVSYARLRVLTALCATGGMTMTQLADALNVTGRRVTALVDALADEGLVERYAHPTDGRSTIVEITDAGQGQQRLVWHDHQEKVAVAFADLTDKEQDQLLAISHKLTASFRTHRAKLATTTPPGCDADPDPDAIVIRNNRRLRIARTPHT